MRLATQMLVVYLIYLRITNIPILYKKKMLNVNFI